ncbi:MAG: DUF5655 domain-containing protein [Sphaerochaetaceae bacterium]|jgi:hypothetical protein
MTDEQAFFKDKDIELGLYEKLKARVLELWPSAQLLVQRTQVSFYDPHLFLAVSFARPLPKAQMPGCFILATIGLPNPITSTRITRTVRISAKRYTCHIIIKSSDEIDEQLLAMIAFSHEMVNLRR